MGTKRIIAKNTGILVIPKILKFIVGIIRTKIIAVFLGPMGSGIINQLQVNLQNIANFAKAGLGDGTVKLIVENRAEGKNQEVKDILHTYFILILITTFFVYILGFIFSEKLAIYFFGDISYYYFFIIGFAALPVIILSSSSYVILKAYKAIKYIAISEIIVIAISFVIFFPLLFFFKTIGIVIYVTIGYFMTFFIYQYYARYKILRMHNITIFSIKNAKFKKKFFKVLVSFSGVSLFVIAIKTFAEISTRAVVVTNFGIEKMGLYIPILTLQALFTGFILPSITTYLFPRISEARSDREIVGIVNDVFRLMSFATIVFVLIVISTRKLIIPLFYSKEYYEAINYVPYHFSCLLFFVWHVCFKQVFAPTGRLRQIVWFELINNALIVFLVYSFVPKYALWGWMLRFTIVPIVTFILYFGYLSRAINFKFYKENLYILFFSLVSLIIILVLINLDSPDYLVYISSFIFLILLIPLLKSTERKYLLKQLLIIIKKIKS